MRGAVLPAMNYDQRARAFSSLPDIVPGTLCICLYMSLYICLSLSIYMYVYTNIYIILSLSLYVCVRMYIVTFIVFV